MYSHTYIHMHACMNILCIHSMYACSQICIITILQYTYIYMHKYMYVCMYICINICGYKCICINIHTERHAYSRCIHTNIYSMIRYKHRYIYRYKYAHIYIHTYRYTYIFILLGAYTSAPGPPQTDSCTIIITGCCSANSQRYQRRYYY